jgi:hypothetical protein
MFAIGAQPVGEHAAGRAGADDDIVVFHSVIIIVHLVSPGDRITGGTDKAVV